MTTHQVGNVATATAAEEGYWGSVSFVDFFCLRRIDGTWMIVDKTFAHVGGGASRVAPPRFGTTRDR
jgi:hypothetical protein